MIKEFIRNNLSEPVVVITKEMAMCGVLATIGIAISVVLLVAHQIKRD